MNNPNSLLDNFQDIKEVHRIIVFQTGASVGDIGEVIGYSRSHLSLILNGKEPPKVQIEVLNKLKRHFEAEIKQFVRKYSTPANSIHLEPGPEASLEQLVIAQKELKNAVQAIDDRIDALLLAKRGNFDDEKRASQNDMDILSKRGRYGKRK